VTPTDIIFSSSDEILTSSTQIKHVAAHCDKLSWF
jgi:hypothetical protein